MLAGAYGRDGDEVIVFWALPVDAEKIFHQGTLPSHKA